MKINLLFKKEGWILKNSTKFILFLSTLFIMFTVSLKCDALREDERFYYAVCANNFEDVKGYLYGGVDVNMIYRSYSFADRPLIAAVEKGYLDMARFLIEKGADVNLEGSTTPLVAAVNKNNLPMAELLIQKGAKVREYRGEFHPGTYYSSALYAAITKGNIAMADLFIKHGADVDHSAFDAAAKTGNLEMAEFLLQNVRSNCTRASLFRYALLTSIKKGHLQMIEFFLNNGADPNAEYSWGERPLYFAIQEGNTAMIDLLLQYGADINMEYHSDTVYGQEKPLETALLKKDLGMAEFLVSRGAKTEVRLMSYFLTRAIEEKDKQMVTFLVKHGLDVRKLNTNMQTMLMRLMYPHHLAEQTLMVNEEIKHRSQVELQEGSLFKALLHHANPDCPYCK